MRVVDRHLECSFYIAFGRGSEGCPALWGEKRGLTGVMEGVPPCHGGVDRSPQACGMPVFVPEGGFTISDDGATLPMCDLY